MAPRKANSGYPPAPWFIDYYQRPKAVDGTQRVPARGFLRDDCPAQIRAELLSVVKAVADSPPPAFSGGGKWEAMTGPMAGIYQVKANGFDAGGKWHWRLFCVLDRERATPGLRGPSVIAVTGMRKPYLTTFRAEDYAAVRALVDEYLATMPRSIAR